MAEVGILIIFVLLLLLVLGQRRMTQLRSGQAGKESVAKEDIARLREQSAMLQRVALELGLRDTNPVSSDEFTLLIRSIRQATSEPSAQTRLSDAVNTLQSMRHATTEVQRILDTAKVAGSEAIVRQIRDQSFRLANQEGQLRIAENRLVATGQGKGERPCWAQPNGTIDYLYDVVLTSTGIRLREHVYPHRQAEREGLPAPSVNPDETISPVTFLSRTAALFEFSKLHNCRFFVVVFDATKSHEKPLYKDLLRAVEGHFYKRLDNGVAPF